jgi:hypothetical protein
MFGFRKRMPATNIVAHHARATESSPSIEPHHARAAEFSSSVRGGGVSLVRNARAAKQKRSNFDLRNLLLSSTLDHAIDWTSFSRSVSARVLPAREIFQRNQGRGNFASSIFWENRSE